MTKNSTGEVVADPPDPAALARAEGVVLVGTDGIVLAASVGACAILGAGQAELRGVAIDDEAWALRVPEGVPLIAGAHPARVVLRGSAGRCRSVLRIRRLDGIDTLVAMEAEPLRGPDGLPAGVALTIADVAVQRAAGDALRESERAARHLAAEQAALRAVAEAVAHAAEPEVVFALVSREVAHLLGVEAGFVVRFEEGERATVLGEWHAPGRAPVELGDPVDHQTDGALGWVRETGESGRVTGSHEPLEWGGSHVRVAAPIRVGGRLWGAVAAATSSDVPVAEDAELRLARLAELVAVAIVDARSREELRRRLAQQEALVRVSRRALEAPAVEELYGDFADILTEALAAEVAVVVAQVRLERDDSEQEPTTLRAVGASPSEHGGALSPDVAAAARLAITDDAAAAIDEESTARGRTRRTLAVPVHDLDRTFGALVVRSSRPGALGDDDAAFLTACASMLGVAIARARADGARLTDQLTGLPNRALLLDRIGIAIGRLGRTRQRIAVLACDIDDFSRVNDALGHASGDRILIAAADRLAGAMRPGDTIARLGGDEFVVLCEQVDMREARRIAARVQESLRAPFHVPEERHLSVSVGIAVRGREADAEDVLREADAALQRARGEGRGRIEVYDQEMLAQLVERDGLEADLRRAIEEGGFEVHYQTLHGVDDGGVRGVEALVRWRHPRRGLLPPGAFIAVAEEAGLIVQLGRHVLIEACRTVAAWNERRATPLVLGVNVSPVQLQRDVQLAAYVRSCLAETGLDPSCLALEITESVVVAQDGIALERLAPLRELGVDIVVDDFGTGASSISHLMRFIVERPDFTSVKLDRPLLAHVGTDPRATAIVRAIVRMVDELGIGLVAEGVEREEQLAGLRDARCPVAQGFLLSRPRPAHELERTVLLP